MPKGHTFCWSYHRTGHKVHLAAWVAVILDEAPPLSVALVKRECQGKPVQCNHSEITFRTPRICAIYLGIFDWIHRGYNSCWAAVKCCKQMFTVTNYSLNEKEQKLVVVYILHRCEAPLPVSRGQLAAIWVNPEQRTSATPKWSNISTPKTQVLPFFQVWSDKWRSGKD